MNINIQNKLDKILRLKENKYLVAAFLFLIMCSFIFSDRAGTEAKASPKLEADTIIPRGFVLVPLVLENIESITGVINQFGVIDLYAGKSLGQKSIKIASRIKLLRAPLNPNQFAVLVPELLSEKIMQSNGPFWAVIQNRTISHDNTQEEPVKYKKEIQIEYLERNNL